MDEKESPRRSADREESQQVHPLTPEELAGDGPKMTEERRPAEGLRPTPSQAEGERETVEEDLRAKEPMLEREKERRLRERRRPPGREDEP